MSPADQARRKMIETAEGMIGGSISFIEGSRILNSLRSQANIPDLAPCILPFVAIDSETDALPVSPQIRKLWSPVALEKLQLEIDRAEVWARNGGELACRKLIAYLNSN